MERKSQSRTVPALLGFVRGLVVRPPCALLLALSLTCPVEAGPGDLDSSFGTGGKVTTDFGGTDDAATAVAIQANGKIVVAGSSGATCEGPFDFGLARYNTDGTPDITFGTGGKVTTNFGGSDDQASAVAIQADGKIVAAGFTDASGTHDFALA